MIRRHKTTIFLDAKENNTVLELKKMIEGILKYKPEDQQLFKDEEVRNLKSWFYFKFLDSETIFDWTKANLEAVQGRCDFKFQTLTTASLQYQKDFLK